MTPLAGIFSRKGSNTGSPPPSASAPSPGAGQAPPKLPMLYAVLAFAAGIIAGQHAWRPPSWWVASAIGFIIAAIFFSPRRSRISWMLSLGAVVLLGALAWQLHANRPSAPDLSAYARAGEVTVTGMVVRDGVIRTHANPGPDYALIGGAPSGHKLESQQSLDIKVEQIEFGGVAAGSTAGIRLNIYAPAAGEDDVSTQRQFIYGERIQFPAKLRLPRNFGDPGAFDYRGYLLQNGIQALAAAGAGDVVLLPRGPSHWYGRWKSAARRSLFGKMNQLWPPADDAMLRAVLVGERSQVTRDTRLAFQRTGAYHLLVVSGLNVTIFALVIFWAAQRMRCNPFAATLVTIALAAGYAYLTDLGAPIQRAVLMLASYLVTRLLFRQREALNTIGSAALVVLVIDPSALLDAGFQMTFLAVLAIAGIAVPLLDRTSTPYRRALASLDSRDYDIQFAPAQAQFRVEIRMVSRKLAQLFTGSAIGASTQSFIARGEKTARRLVTFAARGGLFGYEILLVSAVMQLALALPMAVYFHRATSVGLLANIVVVPLTGLVMPTAMLALLLSYIWLPLASIPAAAGAIVLHAITGCITRLGGLRFAELRVATPSIMITVAALASLVLAMMLVRRRRWLAAAGLALLFAVAVGLGQPAHPHFVPNTLEVTAIDVGQGDAILVVSPQGRTLLIDGGGPTGRAHSDFDYGEEVVSPYLWHRGIDHLDVVALTHAHSDHLGGLPSVVANFHPRELWIGMDPPVSPFTALLEQARAGHTEVVHLFSGDTRDFGGANLRVLAPPRRWELNAQPRNDDSLAMLFTLGKTSALLEGDAEKTSEELMGVGDVHADLLKVGHHGSATSTTPEFLAAVHPRYAVISVGLENLFGHPKPVVLDRLQQARVSTYRTDIDGAVTFYLDGNSVTPLLGNRAMR